MSLTLRIHTRLEEIPAEHWDALRPDGNPFLSHAFLAGLERHDCVRSELGWQGWHLAWYRGGVLVAALPAYLKGNSHGEFVFDWSWAQAHELSGGRYYPKLVCAVPYTPVTGPRLLTGGGRNATLERALADTLINETRRLGLSGAHINFPDPETCASLVRDPRWLPRQDVQFHWHNRGYRDFDDFLDALNHKKRKNIRQERQRLHAAGWRFERRRGGDLDERDWRFVHALYVRTFAEKGNYPALTEAFFRHLGAALPDHTHVTLARAPDGRPAAMALSLQGDGRLYGRYWGCLHPVPGLHFECCYYQGIEHAIERRLAVFEPGAQGEHKLARGFMPVLTRSFHYLHDAGLRARVVRALDQERAAVSGWYRELDARSPYAQSAD
jgi:predicted N-acyltransferase